MRHVACHAAGECTALTDPCSKQQALAASTQGPWQLTHTAHTCMHALLLTTVGTVGLLLLAHTNDAQGQEASSVPQVPPLVRTHGLHRGAARACRVVVHHVPLAALGAQARHQRQVCSNKTEYQHACSTCTSPTRVKSNGSAPEVPPPTNTNQHHHQHQHGQHTTGCTPM